MKGWVKVQFISIYFFTLQTQEYTVQIPETITCEGCVIRLERQALEWGAKYRFQSCADVDIVKKEVREADQFERWLNEGNLGLSKPSSPSG